jgi:hypothetical protein
MCKEVIRDKGTCPVPLSITSSFHKEQVLFPDLIFSTQLTHRPDDGGSKNL